MRLSNLYKPLLNSLRFTIARLRFDYEATRVESFDFQSLRHVVINKPDGKLGDTEVMSFFIEALKRYCPSLKISVICPEFIASVYKDVLKVTHVEISPKRPKFREIDAMAASLEKIGPCDLLISTEMVSRPRDLYLCHKLKPQIFAGFDSRVKAIAINLFERNKDRHISLFFDDLLQMGGIHADNCAYQPLFTKDDEERVEGYFEGKKTIGLIPFGAARDKRLKEDTITKLCQYLEEHTDAFIVPLLTKDEMETKNLLLSRQEQARYLFLPDLSIREFAAAVAHLSALLSVDTAGVHLAVASHIPLLSLNQGFGDEPKRWLPGPFARAYTVPLAYEGKLISDLDFAIIKDDLENFLKTLGFMK